MSALLSPRLCVYFALPDEAAALLPRMRFANKIPTFDDLLGGHIGGDLEGVALSVTASGMGGRNAGLHLNFLCGLTRSAQVDARRARESHREQIPIRRLLICGFGGGLTSDLPPGSLMVANRVQTSGPSQNQQTYFPDPAMVAFAESISVPGVRKKRGTLATVSHVLTTPDEKRHLAECTGAIAVDMETADAARVAQSQGIPWLSVRAITDGAEDTLPLDFNAFTDEDGNIDQGRVLRATLLRPWKIPALLRLRARSSLAARNLAAFIESFLAALPEDKV
jgi:adenosylhomocysteine nucleosidase